MESYCDVGVKLNQKIRINRKPYTVIDITTNSIYLSDTGGQLLILWKNQVKDILEAERRERDVRMCLDPKKFNDDGSARRAMTSQQASDKKIGGHDNEYDFAEAVDGTVLGGRRKGDVVIHSNNIEKKYVSVKGPVDKIQVFLYGQARFETDEFGELNKICKACINSFPTERNKYVENKSLYKDRLIPHMEELKHALSVFDNLSYFFLVSFFGKRTEYIALKDKEDLLVWHIFHLKSVVDELPKLIKVENSKGSQKVIFRAEIGKRYGGWINVGEVEMRNDSNEHYRELKFRMDRDGLFLLLRRICGSNKKEIIRNEGKIILYADAIEELKFLEEGRYEQS